MNLCMNEYGKYCANKLRNSFNARLYSSHVMAIWQTYIVAILLPPPPLVPSPVWADLLSPSLHRDEE